jgi:hypothetical protein
MPAERESRVRFIRETAEHEMTVLHDDGLYRHVRFQKPDTSFYWFDLITWPGVLTISGDVGCFTFSRLRDMFEFFGDRSFDDEHYGINPGYWAEKLRAPESRSVEIYSPDAYRARVIEWFDDVCDGMDVDETFLLRLAVQEQLLDEDPWSDVSLQHEEEARRRLREFEHDRLYVADSWEWRMWEYDWSFLWACWAIVWGIERYRAAKSAGAEVTHA